MTGLGDGGADGGGVVMDVEVLGVVLVELAPPPV